MFLCDGVNDANGEREIIKAALPEKSGGAAFVLQ
jgi:hypothetical protein